MSGLPEGFEARSKDEWLALGGESDPKKRKVLNDCLRGLGYEPPDYITWSLDERVDKIMEHQGTNGTSNGANGKANPAKAAAPKVGKKPSPGAAKKVTGGTVDLTPVNEAIEELTAQVTHLQGTVDAQQAFVLETHMMMRVFFETNADAKANLEDDALREYYTGRLIDGDDAEAS